MAAEASGHPRGPGVVRVLFRKHDRVFERLNDHIVIQDFRCPDGPLRVIEDDVVVKPGDLGAMVGKLFDGEVEEPLLLPHDVLAPDMQDVFRRGQVEGLVLEGAFDDDPISPGPSEPADETRDVVFPGLETLGVVVRGNHKKAIHRDIPLGRTDGLGIIVPALR